MIKEIKKISNKALELSNLDAYNLSIQLSLDGFSFCINHNQDKELIHFSRFEFEPKPNGPEELLKRIEQLFKEQEILRNRFLKVTVTHQTDLITHVPLALFDENHQKDYLKYTIKLLEHDFVSHDIMENAQIVSVYLPYVNINNFLVDIYQSFIYKHTSTAFIETIMQQFKNADGDYCFVNVVSSNFELLVLKNKQFHLYNYFKFSTKEDFIYYILFTAEQLELNPESFNLVLMGDIEEKSELYKISYDYIRNIQFYKPIYNHPLLKEYSAHQEFTILNQH